MSQGIIIRRQKSFVQGKSKTPQQNRDEILAQVNRKSKARQVHSLLLHEGKKQEEPKTENVEENVEVTRLFGAYVTVHLLLAFSAEHPKYYPFSCLRIPLLPMYCTLLHPIMQCLTLWSDDGGHFSSKVAFSSENKFLRGGLIKFQIAALVGVNCLFCNATLFILLDQRQIPY